MKVLITDGDTRAALAAVRSLGRAGHQVAVAAPAMPCLAQTSRYCHSSSTYRDPVRDERGFIEDLLHGISRCRAEVLLPMAEVSWRVVAANRQELPPPTRTPVPSSASVDAVSDKLEVTKAALGLGITVPRTIVLDSPGGLAEIRDSLVYPLVIKPRASRVRIAPGWLSSAVRHARSHEELCEDLGRRHPAEFPVMLQERIVGPGLGVFLCYSHGVVVARFCHRRIREKPPSGGVSVLCESVAMDPRAEAAAIKLLDHFNWSGPAMVEFKIDSRTGTPVLMEINGRFWGSLQLAIDAGVDFPVIAVEENPVRHEAYRVGVRSRWFWGDVDSLLIRLRSSADEGERLVGKLRALADFLRMSRVTALDNPRPGDWRPFRYETRAWFRNVLSARQRDTCRTMESSVNRSR